MSKYRYEYKDCTNTFRHKGDCRCDEYPPCPPPQPPRPPCPPPQPPRPPVPPTPASDFRSCYIDASGNAQDIAVGGHIVFDMDPDYVDTAGTGISLNSSGTVFTITRPGLYSVEWSINISSATNPVLVGLLENNSPASALSNFTGLGNHSCGALINVTESDIPYTISLHNFGALLSLNNPTQFQNTAASIRIFRFAGGELNG